MCVMTPVVEAPSVVVEHVQPVPVADYAAPASAMTLAALAPVVEDIVPRFLPARSSSSILPLGTMMVASDMRSCVSADHERLGALHDALLEPSRDPSPCRRTTCLRPAPRLWCGS